MLSLRFWFYSVYLEWVYSFPGRFCIKRDRRMYQRQVVRRCRQQSLVPAIVRFEVVSISWETGVVWCTCTIPACILKATISSSATERFLVLRAVLPKTRRVLVGVQQWSTPEGVVTAKRRRFYASRSRGAGLLLTWRGYDHDADTQTISGRGPGIRLGCARHISLLVAKVRPLSPSW